MSTKQPSTRLSSVGMATPATPKRSTYTHKALPAMLNTFMPALMSMEMRVLFWQRNKAAEALYTAKNG